MRSPTWPARTSSPDAVLLGTRAPPVPPVRVAAGARRLLAALRRDFETASLVTGSAEDEARSNAEAWARGEIDPQQAQTTTAVTHSHSFPAAFGVARRGDFAGVRRLLDVAGGRAASASRWRCACRTCAAPCWSSPRCARWPRATPPITAWPTRWTPTAHMFADPWPAGYDAHFFSNIFHDWGEERRRFLARRSFEALPSAGASTCTRCCLQIPPTGRSPLPPSP